MKFDSISEIIENFNLKVTEPSEVRRELLKLISEIHPDKNAGEFRSQEDESNFHRIQNAINHIDESERIPITQTDLVSISKMVSDLMIVSSTNMKEHTSNLESKIDPVSNCTEKRICFLKLQLVQFSEYCRLFGYFQSNFLRIR